MVYGWAPAYDNSRASGAEQTCLFWEVMLGHLQAQSVTHRRKQAQSVTQAQKSTVSQHELRTGTSEAVEQAIRVTSGQGQAHNGALIPWHRKHMLKLLLFLLLRLMKGISRGGAPG